MVRKVKPRYLLRKQGGLESLLFSTLESKTLPERDYGQKQEGHDGPVSLHWLIREIHSYKTLHYLGIGLKHKTPYKD